MAAMERLGKYMARADVASVAADDVVTIRFHGGVGGDLVLPEDFEINALSSESERKKVEIRIQFVGTFLSGGNQYYISEDAQGDDFIGWSINNLNSEVAMGALEVWIHYHHTSYR